MSSNREIIFLIQSFEQPRIIKKIVDAANNYNNVAVYGFSRSIHNVKNYERLQSIPNITNRILGRIKDGFFVNRLLSYLKLIYIIYKKHGFGKKRLYVVGLDLRILSVFIFNSKKDYVISDIIWLYFFGFKRRLLKSIDLFLARQSDRVIYTSTEFYEVCYSKVVPRAKIELNENKLATYGLVHPIADLRQDGIHIAYIGAFRYEDIIKNLLKIVVDNTTLHLNFYGDGKDKIVDAIKRHAQEYNNITFHGPFKNPEALQEIYSNNNLNFVVYDNRLENERIAMPNKYYESGYFNVPIVSATNTFFGEKVLEKQMGWNCDIDYESLTKFFNQLSVDDLIDCHERIKLLDKSNFHF